MVALDDDEVRESLDRAGLTALTCSGAPSFDMVGSADSCSRPSIAASRPLSDAVVPPERVFSSYREGFYSLCLLLRFSAAPQPSV